MNELALFAGAGGGLLASKLLGWSTVGAVEIERYPREVLLQRQRDGMLDDFPVWDDVRTFDGKPWRGLVDVVSGGFPCQDISAAGRGTGLAGERSGLWFEYLRIVEEVRPRYVFAENSPNLRTRGLGTIIEGLTGLGYGVRWGVLGAWHVGAPHKRNRMWVLAYADSSSATQRGEYATGSGAGGRGEYQFGGCGGDGGEGCAGESWKVKGDVAYANSVRESQSEGCEQIQRGRIVDGGEEVPNALCERLEGQREISGRVEQEHASTCVPCWWGIEPAVGRVAHGVASRVDRLKAIGNGQVPLVAATAWKILSGEIK